MRIGDILESRAEQLKLGSFNEWLTDIKARIPLTINIDDGYFCYASHDGDAPYIAKVDLHQYWNLAFPAEDVAKIIELRVAGKIL